MNQQTLFEDIPQEPTPVTQAYEYTEQLFDPWVTQCAYRCILQRYAAYRDLPIDDQPYFTRADVIDWVTSHFHECPDTIPDVTQGRGKARFIHRINGALRMYAFKRIQRGAQTSVDDYFRVSDFAMLEQQAQETKTVYVTTGRTKERSDHTTGEALDTDVTPMPKPSCYGEPLSSSRVCQSCAWFDDCMQEDDDKDDVARYDWHEHDNSAGHTERIPRHVIDELDIEDVIRFIILQHFRHAPFSAQVVADYARDVYDKDGLFVFVNNVLRKGVQHDKAIHKYGGTLYNLVNPAAWICKLMAVHTVATNVHDQAIAELRRAIKAIEKSAKQDCMRYRAFAELTDDQLKKLEGMLTFLRG